MSGKKIGIWLDRNEANIIFMEGSDFKFKTITSQIEDYRIHGGSRSKTPYGPMDKVADLKYLERQKHQIRRYLIKIIQAVKHAEELYIFGPAQTRIKLFDEIKKIKHFKPVVAKIESADSMTKNQKIAKVRDFFSMQEKI